VGISVDACNRSMVTAGIDGWLRVWDFKKRAMLMELEVGCAVNRLAAHAGSALVAVACDDLVLRM
jgi:U3 small nucleolar RNA-associated protein 21